jgi:hypothetical protein
MKVFTVKGELTDSGIINRLKDQFEYILCGPELFKSGGEFKVKILDKNSLVIIPIKVSHRSGKVSHLLRHGKFGTNVNKLFDISLSH